MARHVYWARHWSLPEELVCWFAYYNELQAKEQIAYVMASSTRALPSSQKSSKVFIHFVQVQWINLNSNRVIASGVGKAAAWMYAVDDSAWAASQSWSFNVSKIKTGGNNTKVLLHGRSVGFRSLAAARSGNRSPWSLKNWITPRKKGAKGMKLAKDCRKGWDTCS